MPVGPIDYVELTRDGLRSVMARALTHTAEHGLYGDQHFYITYLTGHPGVVMPGWLTERYPSEITIVMQYDFHDLAVMDDRFTVRLSFSNQPATLVVPFAAVKSFMDPSVNFRIDIPMPGDDAAEDEAEVGGEAPDDEPEAPKADGETGTVVSLDAFRKK